MPIKAHASKKKKRIITNVSPVDKQLDLIGHQIMQGKQQMTLQEMLEALHDFKEVVTFKLTGG